VEIKPLGNLPPPPPPSAAPSARAQVAISLQGAPTPVRPTVLTQRGTEVLVQIERLMEAAGRALNGAGPKLSDIPPAPGPRGEAFASAGGSTTGTVRGN
jgi:hypothetical protein